MSYKVVTIYDDGPIHDEGPRTRIAVVKTLEEDDDAWGVVAYYPTLSMAHRAAVQMQIERDRAERSRQEIARADKARRDAGKSRRSIRLGVAPRVDTVA
jgi:hypothetical protein